MKLQRKDIEIEKTRAELAAAQQIVSKVMSEGGSALEQYHIKHFMPEGSSVWKKCKGSLCQHICWSVWR